MEVPPGVPKKFLPKEGAFTMEVVLGPWKAQMEPTPLGREMK